MNEMKHFFNTTSVDTIGECLNGEKLLNASRNEKGNTLLTFESAYEGYSDLLTITPDGSVIGTFICDEEQQPQTVNDTSALPMRSLRWTILSAMRTVQSFTVHTPTSWTQRNCWQLMGRRWLLWQSWHGSVQTRRS